jgi:hypothetical protein
VAEGLLTGEQADRIRQVEARHAAEWPTAEPVPSGRPAGTSLVIEALGYIGGILILVAAGIFLAQVWSDLSVAAELAIVGLPAAVLLVAGVFVPATESETQSRLRAVLWLLSTAAAAGFLALLATDGFDWAEADAAVFAAGGTSIYAALLWRPEGHVLQQAGLIAAIAWTAASAVAELSGGPDVLPGLAILGVGVAWFVLGWGGWLGARRPAYLMGAAVAGLGSIVFAELAWGHVVALLTVAATVVVAVLFRDLALLAIGAILALLVLPSAVDRFFPGVLAVPVALLVAGLLVVGISVAMSRRQGPAIAELRDYATGPAGLSIAAASGIIAVTAATVLLLGLR